MKPMHALWGRLYAQGLTVGAQPTESHNANPWYLRVMSGIGGWIGSLFLLGFVLLAVFDSMQDSSGAIVVGLVLCGGATWLLRSAGSSDFATQAGFAVSLAGQGSILFGCGEGINFDAQSVGTIAVVMGLGLFFAIPLFTHRVWCAGMVGLAAFYVGGLSGALVLPLVISATAAWLWLSEFNDARSAAPKRAAGYGLTLALAALFSSDVLQLWTLLPRGDGPASLHITLARLAAAGQGVVLLVGALVLLRRQGTSLASARGRALLALAAVLAAACYFAPGLGPFLLVLLVGFANGNRVLTGLGTIALLAYLSRYYYDLEMTLLSKSLLLMMLGAVLLVARTLLNRITPTAEERAHA